MFCLILKWYTNERKYSLFDLSNDLTRIYIRYSKIHGGKRSFYGLRDKDLNQLEGLNSFICFIWDKQKSPVFLPFYKFEEIFSELKPASDGQYKVQIFHHNDQTEIYIPEAGRFNIESFFGWNFFEAKINTSLIEKIPKFTHYQIQTLIGSIGQSKGYDIWIPLNDRNRLDWEIANKFNTINNFPKRYDNISSIVKQIDVIWLKPGTSDLQAMFEVEHSTPIYSGLLRFNDLHLIESNLQPRFSIVSNTARRSLYFRQTNRPTFKISGLSELCNFLEYKDVFGWFKRIG